MSEFRQDIVSGDWVIIASNRAKRPDELVKKKPVRASSPKSSCPFEDFKKSGNRPLMAGSDPSTGIAVVANKYPALEHAEVCAMDAPHGLYATKTGVGGHELVVTRDHVKGFADIDSLTARKLFEVFRTRHRILAADPCLSYIATFMNWGPLAGASISHPHYQTLALPIVPPHIVHSLRGAETYFKKHRRCVRCDVIAAELKEKKRIVSKNARAVAFAPFASKHQFEVSIFPRQHEASFSKTPRATIHAVADLLQDVLRRMKRTLHDPDFNFFIHGAPLGKSHPYHHWHIEIVPVNVVSPPGGFEAATSVDINVIDPDKAAEALR